MAKLDITTIISQHSDILTSLFHHMSDMFFLMAVEKNADGDYQFRYVLMNPAAMKGANLGEDTYGKLIEEVYPPDKADLLNSMYRQTVEDASPTHFTTKGDMIGESILSPVFNSDGVCTHVFSVTRDITERKKLEWQLEYMAYHDVLTGLPNRRLLYENLQQSLEKAKEAGEMVAALYLDCDHFKQINDTLGHDAGDTFLKMLAQRLQDCVREQDMVARLGGRRVRRHSYRHSERASGGKSCDPDFAFPAAAVELSGPDFLRYVQHRHRALPCFRKRSGPVVEQCGQGSVQSERDGTQPVLFLRSRTKLSRSPF
ncbi:diguanylate cyclase domain-containing protein [Brevibacillus gelatini]